MKSGDKVFAGAIPEIYNSHLVPMLFADYAVDLAQRIAFFEPRAVLETAAGTGAVTRALALRLPERASYVASDLNQPMLDYAAAQQPDEYRIRWCKADAMNLPFDDTVIDVVCCQFGVMFFPGKVEGFRQAHRTLGDGGRFIFNTWDRIEENEFADNVTGTMTKLFPDNPPVFLSRTPHGYYDVAKIEEDVRRAGFKDVEVTSIPKESEAANAHILAFAFCQETLLRNELEARDASRLDEITNHVAEDLSRSFGPGPITGKMRAPGVVATE